MIWQSGISFKHIINNQEGLMEQEQGGAIVSLDVEQRRIIALLQELHNEVGRTLTSKIINNSSMKGRCPSLTIIANHFGSVGEAMKAAGLDYQDLTREGMVSQLRALAERLGRTPLHNELDGFQHQGLCFNRRQLNESSFSGYEEVIKLAGLEGNHGKKRKKKRKK